MSTSSSRCPVCRGREGQPRYEIEGVASIVVVCGACGTGRLEPMPDMEEVQRFYPNEYYGEPGTKFQPLV